MSEYYARCSCHPTVDTGTGEMCLNCKDTHGYPINWVPGMNIVRFHSGSMGILVEIGAPIADEPRTFYRVATPQGLVSIFEGFTRIIK